MSSDHVDRLTVPENADETLPTTPELKLLAKLEEANRLIETDAKSLNSLSGASGHSRKSSDDTSQISMASAGSSSNGGNGDCLEKDLWTLWGKFVIDWENEYKKNKQYIKDLVRQGIPHHFRAIVWQLLSNSDQAQVKTLYSEYLKMSSAYEKVIKRDLARTYPQEDFFKAGAGQEALFNVMKAYSLHDREVGYCQGSAFIVGLLLLQMPEEDAFAVVVQIMQSLGMRDMFKPSMAKLGLCIYQLEHLVIEHIPELHYHFQQQNFLTSMYASGWFLTLFSNSLSIPMSCRVMDWFLSEGIDIIFKLGIAILMMSKDELLGQDIEGMQLHFQKGVAVMFEADPENVLKLAFGIKINPKKMKFLEKQHAVIKNKERDEMGELKRLRTENKYLLTQLHHLEVESASLAENLVRFQVEKAQSAEIAFALTLQLAAAEERLEAAVLSSQRDEEESPQQSYTDEASLREEILQRDEMIYCLQQELEKIKTKEAETASRMTEFTRHMNEIEYENKYLRESTVDNTVAHLQEELIAVKLREAEANLSLKDLRQRVTEVTEEWQRFQQEHKLEQTPSTSTTDVLSTPKKFLRAWENRAVDTKSYEEEIMKLKIKELDLLAELKVHRLKVMEQEAHVQVSTNQLRRQDLENTSLREELNIYHQRDRDHLAKHKEESNKYSDLQSKSQYEKMLTNIRFAENAQKIAELEHGMSVLQIKYQVLVTEGELRNTCDSDKERDLQDKVADLKAEFPTPIMNPENEPWKWLES